jgi:hypothetical protein
MRETPQDMTNGVGVDSRARARALAAAVLVVLACAWGGLVRAAPAPRCADGTTEQVFLGGMVGCGGAVGWAARASLCGANMRPATQAEWNDLWGKEPPVLAFWTEGNRGSGTAGTACVPNVGCADGSVEQVFPNGMVGCAGAVAWASRRSLCAGGYRVASAAEWVSLRLTSVPLHDYWTHDDLEFSGSASSCSVSTTTGKECPNGAPMRVCTAAGTDAEGNTCNWQGCGLDATDPPEYFGGCVGNNTAGALCVPTRGCADGSAEQVFPTGLVGCAGHVAFADRASLCAAGYRPATGREWDLQVGGAAKPSHDYWTADLIGYNGSASLCYASWPGSGGSLCLGNLPMRLCTAAGGDAEGNTCYWTQCYGQGGGAVNRAYGGCTNDTTAGTLCTPDPRGCAGGAVPGEQLPDGLVGCPGTLDFSKRDLACAPGYRPALARELAAFAHNYTSLYTPMHTYWTADDLHAITSVLPSCTLDTTGPDNCPGPGRVCFSNSGADAEGNTCATDNCWLAGMQYASPLVFGGCGSAPGFDTAGVLCIRQ